MDTALAAELIEAQFPELAPAHVTFLGAGCDSTAFQVNDGIVFRFPGNRAVERQIDIEDRILPELARHLPVRVPLFRFRGSPSLRFDRRFIGYQKLPGEPGIRLPFDGVLLERIAGPLARVLDALHAFPVESARRAGVPEEWLESTIREVRVDALGDLDRVRKVAADAPIGRWRHFIEDGVQVGTTRLLVLVHNDLAAEHVLIDPDTGAITGIIDWSDIAISDPAVDFAGLFHWGGELLVERVLQGYRGDLTEDTLPIARYLAACRGAMDVAFGLDRGRPEYVTAGLRALGGVRS